MPLDYETLRLIWWVLLGVLLIGFALTDGYDLGVAALLPFVGRTDEERRLAINAVAPHWEGHQVWLILGGGAIFAAWPFVYAISFSGFYLAIFLVLASLILRPVAFKYRSKHTDAAWRNRWDWALFVGGLVPALVFGVAVGNAIEGAPFRLDSDLRMTYEGSLLGLFTPFTLVAGLLSVAMLALHGAGFLAVKIEEGPVLARARGIARVAALASIVLFILGGVMVAKGHMGMRLTGVVDTSGPSNPLMSASVSAPGAWLDNYGAHPWMWIAPVLGIAGSLMALAGISGRRGWLNFAGTSIATTGIISTVGLSMFPYILPSTIDPRSSLTVWNASSSHVTLFIMLVVTIIFLPIVLGYTAWVIKALSGRLTIKDVRTSPDFY
ncbi:cytochrome d ubiquinol oxidase, subunit II [Novosphingobium nitrogenifigens DSM 19370]|uniref:Cytochrome d ubiquinol oxidase, subunit II n=2 Tax=Novosphingobium nitrogenifigens TaxID=378548 RepID=F1Z610_9SPHN|nr:cytochrome d ubiquinol oxidase, subunit II [Novosphingobium nitrogenifigens DSM 19370]